MEMLRKNVFYRYVIRPSFKMLTKLTEILKKVWIRGKQPKCLYDRHPDLNEKNSAKPHNLLIPKTLLKNNKETASLKASVQKKEILEKISGIEWYHTINLGHGVMTPGAFDHNPLLSAYNLPERFDDMTVLDVATFDGFWAFEFERRGASKVVALDIEAVKHLDLPPIVRTRMSKEELNREIGRGFEIAQEILGSKVSRKILSVYDLSPQRLGKFDIVFCSDLLIHLMNPAKALQNIYSVVTKYALIVELFDPVLDCCGPYNNLLYYGGGINTCLWWVFGKKCIEQMIWNAGFQKVELLNTFKLGLGPRRMTNVSAYHALFKATP